MIDSGGAEQVSVKVILFGHMVVTWAWDACKSALTQRH